MAITKNENRSDSLGLDETYVSLSSPALAATFSIEDPEARSGPISIATPIAPSVAPSNVTEDYSFAPSEDVNNVQQRNMQDDNSKQLGAGVVAAVIVMPLLGPVLAVVAGVAAAYGTTQSGPAGDACRAAGDVALIAKDKANEVNRKHHIFDKTKNGAQGVIAKAQDVNGRHEILEKLKAMLIGTIQGVGDAFQFVAKKLKKRGTGDATESEWETDGYEELRPPQKL